MDSSSQSVFDDTTCERLSRAMVPDVWAIVTALRAEVRPEYERALLERARAALELALPPEEGR